MSETGDRAGKKDLLKKIGRMLGFYFPDRLIVARKDQEKRYLEDPHIKIGDSNKTPRLDKDLTDQATLQNIEEHLEETDNNEDGREYSLAKDNKNDKTISIQGNIKEYFEPRAPSDFYPQSNFIVIGSAIAIYTIILFFAFGVIQLGYLWTSIIVFLGASMVYQGYHIYNSNIQTLNIAYKGQLSNLEFYVPMRREYLAIHETDEQDFKDDNLGMILSFFRSILAENRALSKENNNMESRVQKAFLMGQRKVLGTMRESKVPSWSWMVLSFILGLLFMWLVMGGLTPVENSQIIEGVIGL